MYGYSSYFKECALNIRIVLHGTNVQIFAMYPNIFVAFNNSVDHLWTYINIFELVCVSSFPTSGVTSSICLFSTHLSFCLLLKVSQISKDVSSILRSHEWVRANYVNPSWLYRFQLYLTRSLFSHLPNLKSHNIFETPFRNIRCCLCDAKHLAENGIKKGNIRMYSHIQLFGIR